MPERPAAQLFYSYSHKDEKLRERLEVHLAALKREGLISSWHDRKIGAGTEWKDAIDDHLKATNIILLLISADFLASDYCYDVELRYAMERHQKGEARVIPVILQPCDWHTSSFANLQALPKDGKPITKWPNRNDAFVNIAAGIRKALDDMGQRGSPATVPKQLGSPTISASAPIINALHGLPAPPADFIGRAAELTELLEAVKTGGVTISGLQGMGGIGKTALALKLADKLKVDYPDAQFYVDLKGVTQPLGPKEAMAHVIRAWNPLQQLPEKEEDVAALFRSVLDGKRALLLMDNARDADQLRPLIPPTSCLLLVTSRQRFALPGLVEKDLSKLSATDGCALLAKITPRLGREKKDVLENLADLCGYLPLALEKVASALKIKKNISASDYAYRLADARNRLQLTETDAALHQSYDLLSQKLQKKFCLLSVFPDTFDLSGAGGIWQVNSDEAVDLLAELFAYSLVEYHDITQRYLLHDLVRLFADQRLSSEERMTARKSHAVHYLEVLHSADKLFMKGGESLINGLALFDLEWGNIQAGQAWVVKHAADDDHTTELCWRYADAGAYCLPLRQHPYERIQWLDPALRAARKLGRIDWESAALGNLGVAYKGLGEYRRSVECEEQALQIARKIGDGQMEANALGNLGNACFYLGELERATECYEQGLQIAHKNNDRKGEAYSLGNLGNMYMHLGEHRRAIEHYERVQQIARAMGDRPSEAKALFNIGLALHNLGSRDDAIAFAKSALKIYDALKSSNADDVRNVLVRWRKGQEGK